MFMINKTKSRMTSKNKPQQPSNYKNGRWKKKNKRERKMVKRIKRDNRFINVKQKWDQKKKKNS